MSSRSRRDVRALRGASTRTRGHLARERAGDRLVQGPGGQHPVRAQADQLGPLGRDKSHSAKLVKPTITASIQYCERTASFASS